MFEVSFSVAIVFCCAVPFSCYRTLFLFIWKILTQFAIFLNMFLWIRISVRKINRIHYYLPEIYCYCHCAKYIWKSFFKIHVYPNYSAYIFYFKMNLIGVILNLIYVAQILHCCPPIFIINAFYQKIPTFVYMLSHGISCVDWYCRYTHYVQLHQCV